MSARRTSTRARKPSTTSKRIKSVKQRERFEPGMTVETSGVYEAFHGSHRVTHEVTLINGQEFPYCSRCKDRVRFELVRADQSLNEKNSPLVHVIGVFLPEAA